MGSTETAIARSAQGARALLLGALGSRVLTFALNTLLLRYVSAEVVGFAGGEMELLVSTVLFVSREAPRLVALRAPLDALSAGSGHARAQLVNLAWLPVPLGLALAGALSVYVASGSGGGRGGLPGERAAVLTYCLSTAIEALAEPAYILSTAALLYSGRASAEFSATLLRCVVTFVLAALGRWGVLAYAGGQLVYSLTLLVGYWATALSGVSGGSSVSALLPSWSHAGSSKGCGNLLTSLLGEHAVSLLPGFALQGLVKHALTEGDRIVLNAIASRAQRGEYAVVSNYGSLAVRILFQPAEESLRGLVSKLIGGGASVAPIAHEGRKGRDRSASRGRRAGREGAGSVGRGTIEGGGQQPRQRRKSSSARAAPAAEPSDALTPFHLAVAISCGVCRCVLVAGLLFAALGSAYAPLLVRFALRGWTGTSVPSLLGAYAVYVLFLALNGVTEAFAAAAADATRLRTANAQLAVAAVVCAALALFAVPVWGLHALVAVNSLNMALRSASSAAYAVTLVRDGGAGRGRVLRQLSVWEAFRVLAPAAPRAATLAAIAVAGAAAHSGRMWLGGRGGVEEVAAAAGVCLFAAAAVVALEGRRARETWRALRGGRGVH